VFGSDMLRALLIGRCETALRRWRCHVHKVPASKTDIEHIDTVQQHVMHHQQQPAAAAAAQWQQMQSTVCKHNCGSSNRHTAAAAAYHNQQQRLSSTPMLLMAVVTLRQCADCTLQRDRCAQGYVRVPCRYMLADLGQQACSYCKLARDHPRKLN
jgi:hypothetical protein